MYIRLGNMAFNTNNYDDDYDNDDDNNDDDNNNNKLTASLSNS